MWMTLASGLQAVASVDADDVANAAPEADSDALLPEEIPGFDGKLPTPQQLLEVLDSMTGMSDEEKASLKEDLLRNIQGDPMTSVPGSDLTMQTVVLLSLLGVVALIFVFFVYKLFKCLKQREAKREEKKKIKQMKKKK
ncbi:uncharacterized protein LOC128875696 isoform X1 [Hylaeus volcanicus]|uniref:uncharacterized protein LOC128875696 isoform X1 n=1 Tax=Hylaeus volcanicus TaxID=313075 RepID=UPI0023B7B558|nr:uncharacterized protein LOC128875696 isoform X1 [Hylaeus volcanicus]